MVEFNFLENYSFESGDLTGWKVNDIGGSKELYVEKKKTDSLTGEYHMHFWSDAKNSVEFTLEQEVSGLSTGKYKYTISIMGGDAGDSEIFSYVKINGEIAKKQPMKITVYNEWDAAVIDGIEYKEGDTITVGIYVRCAGDGNGAWGKIDDALLNSVK